MKIFAHRGYSAKYPENTMIAFKKAIEYHSDGIETDVHKTKDGKLVLIHDESIDRTSNGTGMIKDMTYDELNQYNYGYYDTKTDLPLLSELLELVKENNILLNIELKTDNYHYEGIEKDVLEMVKSYDLLDSILFSSFNIDSILITRELEPNANIGYLFENKWDERIEMVLKHNIKNIHPDYHIYDSKEIDHFHQLGIQVNSWTINDEEVMEDMQKHHLDILITNEVELGLKVKSNEIR